MSDPFEKQGWVRLGVATALAKEFTADQKQFLGLLAKTLEQMLPGEAQIKTKGWFGGKTVVGIAVKLGDLEYGIEDPGHGALSAWRKKFVRGIALKTEPIGVNECLEDISAALEERAKRSADGRNALAALLGLQ